MLVLRRKVGEAITVTAPNGDVIRFVRVDLSKVGVMAPRDYEILRDELVETEGES